MIRNKLLLLEGSRDRQLEVYLPYFEKAGINVSISQLKQMLLAKFVNEAGMHNLSLRSNYYLTGVAKYYFNGDLTENKELGIFDQSVKDVFKEDVCQRLDALIVVLRNAYIDSVGTQFEQPEDFGELSLNRLLRKYNKKINQEIGITPTTEPEKEKATISNDYTAGNGYTYEILYTFGDATKYNKPTAPGAWCITYGEQHFNSYQKNYGGHFIIFAKDGFNEIPRQKGRNWTPAKPQDEFGNSLIAVLQSNTDPQNLPLITSRWNHGTFEDNSRCEADHAYTKQEFLKIIGDDGTVLNRCFEQWKHTIKSMNSHAKVPRKEVVKALRKAKYAQMLLNSGMNYDAIKDVSFIRIGESQLYKCVIDDTFYTLAYKKKIYFDDFFETSFFLNNNNLDKNAILIKSGDYTYIFDQIHKRFIDVDGIKKFKYISMIKNLYICVALGMRQKAIINFKTMKPFSYDGNVWFEYITQVGSSSFYGSRNKVELPRESSWTNDEYLRLTYDSSAGMIYLYSIRENRIVPVDIPGGETVTGAIERNNVTNFVKIGNWYNEKLYDPKTNKFIELDGNTSFNHINVDGCILTFGNKESDYSRSYSNDGYKLALYDLDLNDFIRIDGKPVILDGKKSYGFKEHDCGNFFCFKYKKNKFKIYDKARKAFYSDEYSGDEFEDVEYFFSHEYDDSIFGHTDLEYYIGEHNDDNKYLIYVISPGKTFKYKEWKRMFAEKYNLEYDDY